MPELPEVETTRRALEPALVGRRIETVRVHQRQLRWPVPKGIETRLKGQVVRAIGRRAKYLLLNTDSGTALIHLGMSGSLRLAPRNSSRSTHEHLELLVEDGDWVRLRDPRRFGAVLWGGSAPHEHPLLARLGPEPLANHFSGQHLYARSRGRRLAIKNFIMNSHIVVGVGNIYASEALFRAGIHPLRAAGRVSRTRYLRLADCIRDVLNAALIAGGTTLRDYVHGPGETGEFSRRLSVYGRAGEPCLTCAKPVRQLVIGARSSFYCPACQR